MRKKILLVEDDHDTLDLLELFLYKDYEIITALNGFEGLAKAEKELPDLITTDITMPVMDGIRFFNRAGRNEAIRHVPIVAITSFAENVTVKSLLSMGFSAVLSKPLEKEMVEAAVAKALTEGSKRAKRGGVQ
ncbi:MAG: response regulator [Chitinispirillales bacterium]|jgi:CheY-like chemotaxis protein|nr:response regulator [Chitinispirillales bacterium]